MNQTFCPAQPKLMGHLEKLIGQCPMPCAITVRRSAYPHQPYVDTLKVLNSPHQFTYLFINVPGSSIVRVCYELNLYQYTETSYQTFHLTKPRKLLNPEPSNEN